MPQGGLQQEASQAAKVASPISSLVDGEDRSTQALTTPDDVGQITTAWNYLYQSNTIQVTYGDSSASESEYQHALEVPPAPLVRTILRLSCTK